MSFRAASSITALGCALCLLAGSRAASGDESAALPQPAGWPHIRTQNASTEQLGPGVRYDRFVLTTDAGPLVVSVATVDLRNPFVGLSVRTHDGVIVGRGERLSSMADALGAELGINADYFDINESGSPLNLVAIGDHVLHAPSRAATFVMDAQGHVFMGAAMWQAHLASSSGAALDIALVNEWSPSVDLALITPQLGPAQGGAAMEMVLDPMPGANQYRVARMDRSVGSPEELTQGELAVAARGEQAQTLAVEFHPGDFLQLSQDSTPSLAGAKLGVGGGPLLVQDGQPVVDAAAPAPEETDVRNPVTGAGLSGDGATLWLVVVDGRRPALSIGLTRPQLADLFLALGATTAMAFDSGGSSEMVVRHQGDLTTSVATTPSDGRERSIADGLFVLNTAPLGPVESLVLKAPSAQVLAGSTLQIDVHAVDANGQPVAVRAQEVSLNATPSSVAMIDRDGELRAKSPGDVELTATLGGTKTSATIRVVGAIGRLSVSPQNPIVPILGSLQFSVSASSTDGDPIAVDPSVVRWTQEGDAGRLVGQGTFVAGPRPARSTVTASVAGISASVVVLCGDHEVAFQSVPQPGAAPGLWSYAAKPADLPGRVDSSAAPDGSAALRLAYDFSGSRMTRASYAQTETTLPGQPIALGVEVFGDGNGEWLRAGYRNADGNLESLTIARRVDWRGWKTMRVTIPEQAAWPIVLTRLYVVEASKDAREQGSIWFRNIRLFYPGPAGA